MFRLSFFVYLILIMLAFVLGMSYNYSGLDGHINGVIIVYVCIYLYMFRRPISRWVRRKTGL